MKLLITLFLTAFSVNSLIGQQFIALWPKDRMPNSKGMELEYIEENQRITQVSKPGFYTFFPSNEENNGGAVLICPPGGYQKLTYDIAGFQFAKWLNTLGINAFVLIYRLPNSPDLKEREKGPVQDAQRAMKIIRANAITWKIDTAKIGILGASAGGHLASILGTHPEDFSEIGDSLDNYSFIPNFMILISPVITMGEYTHKGSLNNLLGDMPSEKMIVLYSNEFYVDTHTAPAFIVHAQNDQVVSPMNSLLFYQTLTQNGVKASLHIFPEGEHSIALTNNPGSTNFWTALCEAWLLEMRIINKD